MLEINISRSGKSSIGQSAKHPVLLCIRICTATKFKIFWRSKVNAFVNAVNSIQVEDRTNNGMKTFESSLSNNVDLFFKIGSTRNGDLSQMFAKALGEDDDLAIRNLLWSRDIRGGAGERATPQKLITWLLNNNRLAEAEAVMRLIPELGRWDDMFVYVDTPLESKAFDMIQNALRDQNGLCAKWMPREATSNKDNHKIAVKLRKHLGLTPKQYRKSLVALTNVVETKMCAKQWDLIDFSKLPSVASARYQTAFHKNASEAYTKYKEALVKGEAKVNASALFPHDVIRSLKADSHGVNDTVVQAQWDALPDFTEGRRILAMVDTSGSMETTASGSISCLDVAVSLGLYLANKNQGAFHNIFLQFSSRAEIVRLTGESLRGHVRQFTPIVENTDVIKGFERILDVAVKGNVPVDEMPEYLMILSDMEFDYCAKYDDSVMEAIKRRFYAAGYELPKIVFWNLSVQHTEGNVPVKFNETGVCLVSGFSPAILRSILSGKSITAESVMLEAIGKERYSWK